MNRLEKQLRFIVEADKFKLILRRSTLICDSSVRENDAEHSWHLTLCAILLFEHVIDKEKVDLLRVLKMLIIHDMVEIEAGDADKEAREKKAADNLFSLLPEDQKIEFIALWEEFEAMKTAESKYASAMDRLQPVLQIYFSGGNTWIENNIDIKRELKRNEMLQDIVPDIWDHVKKLVEDAAEKGWLKNLN
jgi:putative hydrolase of HD superfamily